MLGPTLGQERGELGPRARPFLQQSRGHRGELVDVQSREPASERALAVQHPLDDGVDHGPQAQRIPGGHEVQRRSEQTHANGSAVGDRFRQRIGTEAIQSRPERDVRIPRLLRLHADQPLDRLEDGHPAPAQQHLPFEQGAVQRAVAELDLGVAGVVRLALPRDRPHLRCGGDSGRSRAERRSP